MPRRTLCLLTLFVATLAGAKDKSQNWLQVRSPHFVVISNANEKQVRKVADQFERMREVFHTAFPRVQVDPAAPIVVIAVESEKDFRALEPPEYLQKGQLHLGGLFLRAADKNYILMRIGAEGDHPYSVIYHEYTHLLCSKDEAAIPLWLNEGLAEFFENTEIREKEVLLGEPSGINLYLLQHSRLLPLPTLFAVDHNSPYYHEENKGSIFYAESWALTHLLKIGDAQHKTNRLGQYATLLSQNVDATTAATRAFGDLQLLQKELEHYVNQATFGAFKMAAPIQVDDSAFKTEALTLPQAEAIRADFLAYDQREADARPLLAQVLQQDPNNVLAHETMGYLAFRDGHTDDARRWYSQAVQLDSGSYLAHYYFAAMSMRGDLNKDDEARVETSLQASIRLNPSFAPPYDLLSVFYAMHSRNLADARIASLHAIELDPANVDYRINLANVLLALHQEDDAVRVAGNALKVAQSLPDQIRAHGFLDRLQRRREAEERMRAEDARVAKELSSNGSASPQVVVESSGESERPVLTRRGSVLLHGLRRSVSGVIKNVRCAPPALMDFDLDAGQHLTALHSENYFKIQFSALNFTPEAELKPCSQLEGQTATVEFIRPEDKSEKGEVVSVVLRK